MDALTKRLIERKAEHYNAEGYADPTACAAFQNIRRAENALKQEQRIYRPLVYICSPFSADTDEGLERNIENARKYSRFAVSKNTIPITPHLLYPQYMDDKVPEERSLAMHFNFVLLKHCRELWVFGDKVSKGMGEEIRKAEKWQMKVRCFEEVGGEIKEMEDMQ